MKPRHVYGRKDTVYRQNTSLVDFMYIVVVSVCDYSIGGGTQISHLDSNPSKMARVPYPRIRFLVLAYSSYLSGYFGAPYNLAERGGNQYDKIAINKSDRG